jgi:hypothetical protein
LNILKSLDSRAFCREFIPEWVVEARLTLPYLQHCGASNCTDALNDDVKHSLDDADVPRDEQPTRYGRVDVATTNMSHSLQQDEAALSNDLFTYYDVQTSSGIWQGA